MCAHSSRARRRNATRKSAHRVHRDKTTTESAQSAYSILARVEQAVFVRTRLKGAIGDDDFIVPKRRVLKRFHEFKCFLASVALIRCVVRLYLFFVRLNVSTPTFFLFVAC